MDVFIRTEADSRADTGFNSAANRWAGETLTDEDESDGQDRETSDRREAQAEPGTIKAKEARDIPSSLQSESDGSNALNHSLTPGFPDHSHYAADKRLDSTFLIPFSLLE